MKASVPINMVSNLLHETEGGGTQFTPAFLLSVWNDAQRAVAMFKPNTSTTSAIVQLTANTSSQDLSALIPTAKSLISVTRNMGSDGTTPGDAIRLIDQSLLDVNYPSWRSYTGQTAVKYYTYDIQNPLDFNVFPRPHASTAVYVEIEAYTDPAAVVTPASDDITIREEDVGAAVAWCMYRCLGGEREDTPAHQRAREYFNDFQTLLGLNHQTDASVQVPAQKKEVS